MADTPTRPATLASPTEAQRLMSDQIAIARATGLLHATDCPLVAERGWATVCNDCNPIKVEMVTLG